MIHSMILLLALSLGLGIGSFAVSWHKSTQYGLPFIRHLVVFLVALNAVTVIGIFKNYFGENLGPIFTAPNNSLRILRHGSLSRPERSCIGS